MRSAICLAALLLAGCGGGTTSTTTVTQDGKTVAVEGGGAKLTTGAGIACSNKPDFAPVHAGSTIKLCVSAPVEATGRTSGSVSYSNAATPAAVLAWSKAQALGAGFKVNFETETTFSAQTEDKKSLVVMAAPEGSGSQVTVNWGMEPKAP
jgi:hypothetical protein